MLTDGSPDSLRFAVLGPVRAWRGDTELALGPPQQRSLLALLLLRVGQPVPLGEILTVLWGPSPPDTAANVVHRHVGGLRRLLEPGLATRDSGRWLSRGAGGYRLDVDAASVDLHRFRALVEQARAGSDAEQALVHYRAGLALRQGPTAAGAPDEVLTHPVFAAVEREYLVVVREAADLALRSGVPEQVLAPLRHAAGQYGLDEPLQARLVLALGAAGHQAEALAAYQQARSRLADDLGIDPGPELRDAQTRVLRQHTRPEPPTESDTGSASVHAVPLTRPAELPADLPTFTGRRAELDRLLSLFPDDDGTHSPTALVINAISGMAGIGKTALAVHWAHHIAHRFPDGQLYVDLRGFDPSAAAMSPAASSRHSA